MQKGGTQKKSTEISYPFGFWTKQPDQFNYYLLYLIKLT
jgi:hypothetical protein